MPTGPCYLGLAGGHCSQEEPALCGLQTQQSHPLGSPRPKKVLALGEKIKNALLSEEFKDFPEDSVANSQRGTRVKNRNFCCF